MLTTLRIKNLALVADLTWDLQPGYNVITGETGAGKSILIGALNLVLGERADRGMIRTGSDTCSVEAVFQLSKVPEAISAFLTEHGLEPCDAGQLVLRRSFAAAGTNRQFVNGSPTTLHVLAALGQWLVDIHGPHDHQSLLNPALQLDLLDAFGSLQPLRERFATLLRSRQALLDERAALIVDEKTYAHQLDLLRFQVNEINAAKLQPDEEPQLQQEFQRASNASRLLQLSHSILAGLSEEDGAVLEQAGAVGRSLQELQKIDASVANLLSLHEAAVGSLQELQHATAAYADRLEIDPVRFQELEERLNLVQALKRKYGTSLADVIRFGEEAQQKLTALEQRDVEVIRLEHALQKIGADLQQAGQELSAQRRKLVPKLCRAVTRQLADLGFKQNQFDIQVTTAQTGPNLATGATSSGFDTIEFQFAPNPGEAARPLRAIASSGELARVMLAIKTVLAREDQVPVLVFDEVDANIGGETAHTVGQKMRQIAQDHQVLCITHLAPVAAPAAAHFVVSKETQGGRTTSRLQLLEGTERITELARMLGGQSSAARKHAEELLKDV